MLSSARQEKKMATQIMCQDTPLKSRGAQIKMMFYLFSATLVPTELGLLESVERVARIGFIDVSCSQENFVTLNGEKKHYHLIPTNPNKIFIFPNS